MKTTRTYLTLLILISVYCSVCFSCSPATDTKKSENKADSVLKEVRVIEDIPYRSGPSKSWVLDLALPVDNGNEPRPAIVIVHGGGWRAGSKEDFVYRSMLVTYALKGYVTMSVEYRLTQEAPFPACIEDVKCAVRWLRAHAKEYRVDPEHIGAFGHSAGAHLVLMLAMCPASAGLEGDGGWNEFSSKVNSVVGGSTPVEIGPQRAEIAKPEWWPISYISEKDIPPMLLIQGGSDLIVKAVTVDNFVEKMKQAGHTDLEYIRLEELGHDVSYSTGLSITSPAIEKFFASTLMHVTP
jgi:acetyl esterase/lipase